MVKFIIWIKMVKNSVYRNIKKKNFILIYIIYKEIKFLYNLPLKLNFHQIYPSNDLIVFNEFFITWIKMVKFNKSELYII